MWEVTVGGLPEEEEKNANCFQGTGKVTSLIKCQGICKSVPLSRDCNKTEKTLLSLQVREGRVTPSGRLCHFLVETQARREGGWERDEGGGVVQGR